MTTRAMWCESARPMFVQVFPASADFQTPSPELELRAQ